MGKWGLAEHAVNRTLNQHCTNGGSIYELSLVSMITDALRSEGLLIDDHAKIVDAGETGKRSRPRADSTDQGSPEDRGLPGAVQTGLL